MLPLALRKQTPVLNTGFVLNYSSCVNAVIHSVLWLWVVFFFLFKKEIIDKLKKTETFIAMCNIFI